MTDKPGREIPKEYRVVVEALIAQGWTYDKSGKGYPQVIPTDKAHRAIAVPRTPSDRRSFVNFRASVRRAGGKV